MTDRLTGAEVREFQGQAGDPPVSNAGEARSYFNTTTNRMRISENGGAYRDVDPVEETEYVPQPELDYPTGTTGTAAAVLKGGSFTLPRRVLFNRLVFRVAAFTPAAEGIILLYQEPTGRVTDDLSLVATVSFTPVAATTFETAPTEGDVLLSAGLFYALWGQVSGAGNFSLQVYNTASFSLLNTSVVTGTHPIVSSSALDPAAPPASIDPQIGGDLLNATGDLLPIIRFRNV